MNQVKEPRMPEEEPFEETLRNAHELMRRRRGKEACRLLEEATQAAVASHETEHAALYSSVRGSYLIALGENEDALLAYQDAERYSGGEIQHRLFIASHLVDGLKRPEEAIKKIGALLDDTQSMPSAYREALAIRGAAFIALGETKKAVNDLQIMTESLSQPTDISRRIDLTLVGRLVNQGIALNECSAYLKAAEARAVQNERKRTLSRIRALKSRLP